MIQISIYPDRLKAHKITLRQFLSIYLTHKKQPLEKDFILSKEELQSLEDRDFIVLTEESFNPTGKFAALTASTNDLKSFDIKGFTKKYRDLFPEGVKSGDYYVKGDLHACETKLTRFFKKYKSFTPEMVLKATYGYVATKALNNYGYMKSAHYFIEKNGVSELAAYCENLNNTNIKPFDPFEKSVN